MLTGGGFTGKKPNPFANLFLIFMQLIILLLMNTSLIKQDISYSWQF